MVVVYIELVRCGCVHTIVRRVSAWRVSEFVGMARMARHLADSDNSMGMMISCFCVCARKISSYWISVLEYQNSVD